jgi:hypothetical protein
MMSSVNQAGPSQSSPAGSPDKDTVPSEEGIHVDQPDEEGEQMIRDLPPMPQPDGKPHRPATSSP